MLQILQDGELLRARDHREPNHFWADKEVVEDYLPKIGANAFAVYMLLSYYARSSTGRCYPSINTLVAKLGISKQTVRKALNTLATEKLIHIAKSETTSKDGKPMNAPYVYTILSIKHKDKEGVGKTDTQGGQNGYLGVGKTDTPNNIYINNTKEQEDTPMQANAASPPQANSDVSSKSDLKTTPPPTPSPDPAKITDAEKNALAMLCYGTVDAWKDKRYASAMMAALKRLKSLTPGMSEKTIEAAQRDWNKNDFRGQKGQRPKPHQVADEWLVFKERCKTDPACNGQGSGLQSDYVRIPHPDPDKAKLGIFKTVHRSELEAKKT